MRITRTHLTRVRRFEAELRTEEQMLGAACEAMYSLNRAAKAWHLSRAQRDEIYGLKDRLVRVLYERGRCGECVRHLVERECWNCWGEGCWRCLNGVYTTHYFVCFRFEVGGKRYSWHQPERQVEFAFETTAPAETWDGQIRNEDPIPLAKRRMWEAKSLVWWVVEMFAFGERVKGWVAA